MSDAPITVTIKHGKGYDDPWIVFKGSHDDVWREVVDTYALSVSDSLSLAEVVHNAKQVAHGLNATGILGATVKESKEEPQKPKAEPVEEKPDLEGELVRQFEEADSIETLRELWQANASVASKSKAIKDAYVARGKALKEG